VNNLLDIGRIEAGMALQITDVPANKLVEKVVNSLQMQAGQKNIKLTTNLIDGDDAAVLADPPLVEQALYNLVENSIKYTAVNGQVNITLHETEEKVIFEIKDSGIGIAPLDLPRLFDKFYRSSQRDGFQQKSSSLGLAIVKAIAERHHGRVWAESQLGKGSTFYFELPAVAHVTEPLIEDSPETEESV
jgi:signal transduction histidine kinase